MNHTAHKPSFWIGAGVAALISAGAISAPPATPPVGTDASIPFASHSIFTWENDGDKGIWVQTISRKWYYGKFSFPCFGLQFHEAIEFKFGPTGELDHWSQIIRHDHTNCLFSTFVTSDGPPRPQKNPSAAPVQPEPAANPG